MHITPTRSYRCPYHPKDRLGYPQAADSGTLPFVQLKAATAEQARRLAHHVTGCPVVDAERVEGGAA